MDVFHLSHLMTQLHKVTQTDTSVVLSFLNSENDNDRIYRLVSSNEKHQITTLCICIIAIYLLCAELQHVDWFIKLLIIKIKNEIEMK